MKPLYVLRGADTATDCFVLDCDGKDFIVKVPPHKVEVALRAVPGLTRIRKTARFRVSGLLSNARKLMHLVKNHSYGVTDGATKYWANLANMAESSEIMIPPIKFKLKPKQYIIYKKSMNMDAISIMSAPGAGKSIMAIAICGERFLSGQISRLLILCELNMVKVWGERIKKVADYDHHLIMMDKSSVKKLRRDTLDFPRSQGLNIVICNYESYLNNQEMVQDWNPDATVVDESQRIKDRKTKISHAVHKLSRISKFRMILTGTPNPEGYIDSFSQYKFLDPRIFGTFKEFKDRYLIMGGYEDRKIVGYNHREELARKINSIGFHSEVEQDIKVKDTKIRLRMSSEERKYYKMVEKKKLTGLEDENWELRMPNVLAKHQKLQQVASGFIFLHNRDNPKLKHTVLLGDTKLRALGRILNKATCKAVVFCKFIPEIQLVQGLLTRMDIPFRTLTGSVKKKDRDLYIKHFQTGQKIRVLIVQFRVGGAGLDMYAAQLGIYYSKPFSYSQVEQSRGRLVRTGQKGEVEFKHLIMGGTVDEDIEEAVDLKKDYDQYLREQYGEQDMTDDISQEEFEESLEEVKGEIQEDAKPSRKKTTKPKGDKKVATKKKPESKKKPVAKANPEAKKATKKVTKKADTDMTTLADLCSSLNLDAAKARRLLRAASVAKPVGGWEWKPNSRDLKAVEKILAGSSAPTSKAAPKKSSKKKAAKKKTAKKKK